MGCRKIPNIIPAPREVGKHFLVGLYSGGGLYSGVSFGLTDDLCIPKNPYSVFNQRDYLQH